jgi:chemotaxis protein MotB
MKQQPKQPIKIQVRSPRREETETEDWLMTYADTITLLMAFFAILFSLSDPNPEKYKQFATQLRLEGFMKVDRESEEKELKKQLQLMLEDSGFDKFASVSETDKTIELELANTAVFEPGSARFNPKSIPFLQNLAKQLARFNKGAVAFEIEGHTDDSPIATPQYPSNWELSSGRASNVVRFLIAQGIDAKKLRAIGYADVKPKAANRDATGNPIPVNQELNRRVVVKIVKAERY